MYTTLSKQLTRLHHHYTVQSLLISTSRYILIIMNVDQDLFSAYAFYAGVVTLKMLVMSFLTARQRFANGVFISSEDIKGHEKEYKVHKPSRSPSSLL